MGVRSRLPPLQRKFVTTVLGFSADNRHVNGDGHSSLSTHATYSPSKPYSPDEFEAKLRRAWIGVRFNLHPLLAAVSTAPFDVLDTEGYSLFYPDVNEADVEIWASKTVHQHDSSTNADLVAFLKRTAPTARDHQASIHFAPSLIGNSFHVVLVAGHWLTDGRGAIKILDYILNNLNKAEDAGWNWGEEAARLSIPLPVATGRRVAKSGKVIPLPIEEVQAVLSMIIGGDLATQPAFSHPQRHHDRDRSKVDSIHDICLSPSDSKALLDACRAHHVSVTALLNVLLSMAFIGEPAVLGDSKTVPIPFFSTHRGHDLLKEHEQSIGLQLVLAPFGLSSELLRSCWSSYPSTSSDGIWTAARESKRQLVEAVVSQFLAQNMSLTCPVARYWPDLRARDHLRNPSQSDWRYRRSVLSGSGTFRNFSRQDDGALCLRPESRHASNLDDQRCRE